MSINTPKRTSLAAAAAAAVSAVSRAGTGEAVDKLVAGVTDSSDSVRTEAWLGAGPVGAPAVKPLAGLMTRQDMEVARAAKRALWKIVRYVGRPGSNAEKRAVVAELHDLLGAGTPVAVKREVLWMLSEVNGRRSVEPIASLLSDSELREDARMVLQRIPGRSSLAALQAGLEAAPADFKLNIAQSLRQRGVDVPGLACVKLSPVKTTNVKPIG